MHIERRLRCRNLLPILLSSYFEVLLKITIFDNFVTAASDQPEAIRSTGGRLTRRFALVERDISSLSQGFTPSSAEKYVCHTTSFRGRPLSVSLIICWMYPVNCNYWIKTFWEIWIDPKKRPKNIDLFLIAYDPNNQTKSPKVRCTSEIDCTALHVSKASGIKQTIRSHRLHNQDTGQYVVVRGRFLMLGVKINCRSLDSSKSKMLNISAYIRRRNLSKEDVAKLDNNKNVIKLLHLSAIQRFSIKKRDVFVCTIFLMAGFKTMILAAF